jgi:hypothetical protein
MKKRPKINKHDPKIYPRILWVTSEVEDLDKIFTFMRVDDPNKVSDTAYRDILDDYDNNYSIAVTCPVMNKDTNELGVLVVVIDKENVNAEVIAHESVHVADYFYNQLGLCSQDFVDGNESYAYLVGWSAGCISNVLIEK